MTSRSAHAAISSWFDRLSKAARDHLSQHDLALLDDAIFEAVDAETEEISKALDIAEGPAVDEDAPLPDAPERVRLLGLQCDANAAEARLLRERSDEALELLRLVVSAEPCTTVKGRCSRHDHDKPCPHGRARALIHTGEAGKNGSTP
jgi:hypothetical protein